MPKPRVLPVPVFAWPMMSWRRRATGRVSAWMAKGCGDADVAQGVDDLGAHAVVGEGLLLQVGGGAVIGDVGGGLVNDGGGQVLDVLEHPGVHVSHERGVPCRPWRHAAHTRPASIVPGRRGRTTCSWQPIVIMSCRWWAAQAQASTRRPGNRVPLKGSASGARGSVWGNVGRVTVPSGLTAGTASARRRATSAAAGRAAAGRFGPCTGTPRCCGGSRRATRT